MRIWTDIWKFLDRGQRGRLLGLLGVAILMAFSTAMGIAAVIPFFAALADPDSIHRNALLSFLYRHGDFASSGQFITAIGLGFILAVLLSNAINLLGALALTRFASGVGNSVHVALLNDYLHRDYRFHATAERSMLSSSMLHEVDRMAEGVLLGGLTLVTSGTTTLLIVGSMLWFSPAIAAVAIACIGGSYGLYYAAARVRLRHNGVVKSRLMAERGRIVDECRGTIKEITTLQVQGFFVRRFRRACLELTRASVSNWAIANSPRHVLECLTVAGLVSVALLLNSREAGIGPWLPQLTFVGYATYRLLPAMQQLFTALARVRTDRAAFESIAQELLVARAWPPQAAVTPVDHRWRGKPRSDIVLRDVAFAWSPGAEPVLRDVSLRVSAGSMVGIIGPNGAGKTTLIDVILGLLSPQRGSVAVDGVVLDPFNIAAWRSAVAYVPQHVALMDMSVTGNIAFGIEPQDIDFARVREVARLAQIEELIATLPSGYDTRVGDGGMKLSGGQRQRLAIARALYRESSLLVLDEATSSLDGRMEQDLITVLEALRGRCTIVLIAHRLATVRCCDEVFEMERGRIIAHGSYRDMLAQSQSLRHMRELSA